MAEQLLNWVTENLISFGYINYLFVFLILILCGFGAPIPKDLILVAAGLVSGLKATNVHIMLVICFAGVLLGDATMYILGRIFGYRIQKFKPMRKILSPRRFAQVQRQFTKHGIWVLFFARFMPGLRLPIYLSAGMSRRISLLHFLLIDGIASLISVPIWIYLAYYLASNLEELLKKVQLGQSIMHIIAVTIVLFVVFLFAKNYIKKKIKAKQEVGKKA
ncbi:MAG: DedA family protein [Ruminobacter sp.]|nr:DedA family protein [Ruminobacter sp.]